LADVMELFAGAANLAPDTRVWPYGMMLQCTEPYTTVECTVCTIVEFTHTCMHAHTHTLMPTCTYSTHTPLTCARTHTHTHTHTHAHTHTYTHTHTHTHSLTCAHFPMHTATRSLRIHPSSAEL